jgi:hypothetical protein
MNLLTIDPGKVAGWAYFDNDTLVDCGVLSFDPFPETIPWLDHTWFNNIIIEKPKIYPVRQWKGDPNDLISVALIAGWIAGFTDVFSDDIEYVTPQAWKGNRPKEVDHRHTMSRLSTEEKEVIKETKGVLKSQKHNMIDAIGIGLWYLRRK